MATSSTAENTSTPNLATVLLIKRKMAAKNNLNSDGKKFVTPPSQPQPVTGAYSNEKLTYRQDASILNPLNTTTSLNTNEPPKISRKTKQLEVTLLNKKMDEISRKQEEKTNETLGTWRGFDSLNYGFNSGSEVPTTTPVSSVTKEQHTSTTPPPQKTQPSPVKTSEKPITETPKQESRVKTPEKPIAETPRQESPIKQQSAKKHPTPIPRESTPKRVDSPVKDQPKSRRPSKQEKSREATPPRHETIEKQPSPTHSPEKEYLDKQSPPSPPPRKKTSEKPPPSPPPRRSKINSIPSSEETKTPQQQQQPKSIPSKSPTPVFENIIPISSIISSPQIPEKDIQSIESSPLPTFTKHQFKMFPDIKNPEITRTKNAYKSIQRSMDRYRFHLW